MTTHKEALTLALEFIESVHQGEWSGSVSRHQAKEAIKEALAHPEQKRPQNCGTSICSCIECVMEPDYKALWKQMCERCDELDEKLAQSEQEFVTTFDEVWDSIEWDKWRMEPIRELCRMIISKTTQPQRNPLTEEQRKGITAMWSRGHRNYTVADIIDAVEAAHGIKGDA